MRYETMFMLNLKDFTRPSLTATVINRDDNHNESNHNHNRIQQSWS